MFAVMTAKGSERSEATRARARRESTKFAKFSRQRVRAKEGEGCVNFVDFVGLPFVGFVASQVPHRPV